MPLEKLKTYAKRLKKELFVLYLAAKDQRTPWYAKVIAVCVVAYAFSPIDLIPDFIPILGYLDDIIIVPLGIALALKLIPPAILKDQREQGEILLQKGKPKNWIAGSLVILVWIGMAVWIGVWLFK